MDRTTDQTPFWQAWRKTCSIAKCRSEEKLALHNKMCAIDVKMQRESGKTKVRVNVGTPDERDEYIYPEPVGPEDCVAEGAFKDVVELAQGVDRMANRKFADMIATSRSAKPFQTLWRSRHSTGISEDEAQILDEHDSSVKSDVERVSEALANAGRKSEKGIVSLAGFADLSEVNDDSLTSEDELEAEAAKDASRSRVKLVSEYRDYVESWRKNDPNVASAFEFLEVYLYSGNGKCVRSGGRWDPAEPQDHQWHGRKLKSYLFDVIGQRPGGLAANICGYLLGMLRTMARESFRNPIYEKVPTAMPPEGEDKGRKPTDLAQDRLLAEHLGQWLSTQWPRYSLDDRLALCCALLYRKASDPEIFSRSSLSRTGFDRRRTKLLRELGAALLRYCVDGDMGKSDAIDLWKFVFRDMVPDLVRKIIRARADSSAATENDRICAELFLKAEA